MKGHYPLKRWKRGLKREFTTLCKGMFLELWPDNAAQKEATPGVLLLLLCSKTINGDHFHVTGERFESLCAHKRCVTMHQRILPEKKCDGPSSCLKPEKMNYKKKAPPCAFFFRKKKKKFSLKDLFFFFFFFIRPGLYIFFFYFVYLLL